MRGTPLRWLSATRRRRWRRCGRRRRGTGCGGESGSRSRKRSARSAPMSRRPPSTTCGPISTTSISRRSAGYEQRFRHDVMAHVHAFADAAPAARRVIHLGATSADVTDNADLIQLRSGLAILRRQILHVLRAAGRIRARSGAPSRRSATRTCSRHSSRRSASARRCGCRISSSISRTSISRVGHAALSRHQGDDRHAGAASSSCFAATTTRCASSTGG